MTIDILCWSKDRACQLDLTLSSMKKYFKEWKDQNLTILYTYSNDEYKQGYDRVMSLHPEFNWVKETNFRQDTINIFNNGKNPLVSFIVDDDVFVRELTLDCPEFKTFLSNDKIACLSCRMAPYINFCYTANIPNPPPVFNDDRTWNWTDNKLAGDWCYPMSVASLHIFRREDLAHLINNGQFRATNTFEAMLAANPPKHRPLMICFDEAKCFCAALNKVQVENNNRNFNSHSLEALNKMFIGTKRRLNPSANEGLKSNMAHGKVDYIWE